MYKKYRLLFSQSTCTFVSGPETFSHRNLRFCRDMNNQTLKMKDRHLFLEMFNKHCLNWQNFRSSQKVLQKLNLFLFYIEVWKLHSQKFIFQRERSNVLQLNPYMSEWNTVLLLLFFFYKSLVNVV